MIKLLKCVKIEKRLELVKINQIERTISDFLHDNRYDEFYRTISRVIEDGHEIVNKYTPKLGIFDMLDITYNITEQEFRVRLGVEDYSKITNETVLGLTDILSDKLEGLVYVSTQIGVKTMFEDTLDDIKEFKVEYLSSMEYIGNIKPYKLGMEFNKQWEQILGIEKELKYFYIKNSVGGVGNFIIINRGICNEDIENENDNLVVEIVERRKEKING